MEEMSGEGVYLYMCIFARKKKKKKKKKGGKNEGTRVILE